MLQRRRRRRGVVKQGLPLVVQFEFVTWVLLEWSEWFDRNVSCYFSKGAEFQINGYNEFALSIEQGVSNSSGLQRTAWLRLVGIRLGSLCLTARSRLYTICDLERWFCRAIEIFHRSDEREERERCQPDLVLLRNKRFGGVTAVEDERKALLHKIRVGTVWHADANPLLRAFTVMLVCSGPRFRTQKRIQGCIAG